MRNILFLEYKLIRFSYDLYLVKCYSSVLALSAIGNALSLCMRVRSRSIETDQARANAMGAVPIAYARAKSISIALEPCVTDIRHPASCPLAAGQARALAGWPHA